MPHKPEHDPQRSDADQEDAAAERPHYPSRSERPIVSTLSSIIATFSDFLTVAIHTVLYEREIYSPDLFISTRAYNHPVRQARHPTLCKWIQDAVEACAEQLSEGKVSRISMVILSPIENLPLERYVWDVSSFPTVPPAEHHTPFQSPDDPTSLSGTTLADIEEQLRASLGKISIVSAKLAKLPKDCTFTITIELKQDAAAPSGHTKRWVPTPARPVSKVSHHKSPPYSTANSKSTPIRTVEAGALFMEMWIEESKYKDDLLNTSRAKSNF
ncbi:DNA-binding protein [Kalaharituber pfeilii]|nr:DNA-binding protein [Kalaharituber pfeilii]